MWNGHLRVRRLVRLAPVVIFLLATPKARAQRQTTGRSGFGQRYNHHQRNTTFTRPPKFCGVIKGSKTW